MTTARDMKDLALSKMPRLIEILVKRSEENDIQAQRLLTELAGMTRMGAGRPASKRRDREEVEPTDAEVKARTKVADQILEEHDQSDV
jgi:hypothetical protein